MRALIAVVALTLGAVIVFVVLALSGGEPHTALPSLDAGPLGAEPDAPRPGPRRLPPNLLRPDTPPDEEREVAFEQYDGGPPINFGEAFEKKWYADRERLGLERHREMEKLWWAGRRPRGETASIEKLEELLRDYPDTNRAGCAAYELGQHYMRSRALPLEERRRKAEAAWRLAMDRYRDGICEYNAPVAGSAKLALVSWIYRHTDPGLARNLLEDLAKNHAGETDHLGQEISKIAERLLSEMR
ncbi:MAG: hypothetical protein GYA21_05190 [Myxococcales bacterium]|nr:hypothetical protein [Myxococcales bacterium]